MQTEWDITPATNALDSAALRIVDAVQDALMPIAEGVAAKANAAYSGSAAGFKAKRGGAGKPITVSSAWFPTGLLEKGTLGGRSEPVKRKRNARKRGNYQGAGIQARHGLKNAAQGVQELARVAALNAVADTARRAGLDVS